MAALGSLDPDHALAIILQARFNEEAKKEVAKNKENVPVPIPRPVPKASLVPIAKPVPKASLVDPEWETTDPCPDIHGLFIGFNERFFWGRLLGVEVKWSPQMTSCAGICVYEGRNGLCSVRLSAPLLKLRPRSDLVETLLHEMIHAYLFVTNNNRDREGHGPEFHKHMYRINKEAGTNISVYHSFHAEVKLYQQHWWRCNGPCQSRPPFFGMVKRARNRAPGPNDLWWADHQAACGGQFVKVREPEDYNNKNKKSVKVAKPPDGKDIRNFFKKPASKTGPGSATATSNNVVSNVFGINNLPNSSSPQPEVKRPAGDAVNRVVGFGNLSSNGTSSTANKRPATSFGGGHVLGRGTSGTPKGNNPSRSSSNAGKAFGSSGTPKGNNPSNSSSSAGKGFGRGGMLANRGGGTLVVTGSQGKSKSPEKVESPNTKLRVDKFKPFVGSGFTLGSASGTNDRSRSRLLSLVQDEPERKKPKVDQYSRKSEGAGGFQAEENGLMCNCSVCGEKMPREEVDMHLETCLGLQNVFNNSSVEATEDNDVQENNEVPCPVCNKNIRGDVNSHLDECLNYSGILNMVDDSVIEINDSVSPNVTSGKSVPKIAVDSCDSDVEIVEPEDRVACFICGMRFGKSRINDHVNHCLDSGDDDSF